MNRRRFIQDSLRALAGSYMLSQPLLTRARQAEPQRPPNILFIFADDLGWGDLGCYGHPRLQTPNLDKLAAQGTRFTQFYVCSGVCSPSRTALLTGKYPARLGIHGHLATHEKNQQRSMPDSLDPNVVTVPQLLRQAGYTTGHFGKWHLGTEDADKYGYDQARTSNGGGKNGYAIPPGGFQELRNQSSELFTNDTIKFIEKNKDRPFFANLWFLDPHATLDPSEEMTKPYKHYGQYLCNGKYQGAEMIYYSIVTNMDKHVGRVLDKLDELGLADNTIVIFSSDNGPEDIHINNASHSGVGSAGPFRGRKRSLYEGGLRVPLIVRWPDKTPTGAVDDTSVLTAADMLPTFCALAGVDTPEKEHFDGENVAAAFRGDTIVRNKPIFWEWRFGVVGHVLHRSPMLAIRSGKWKLLMNPDGARVELYDIPADPSELHNRADDYPQVVQMLSEQLLAWQKTLPPGHIDSWAGSNEYPWPQPLSEK